MTLCNPQHFCTRYRQKHCIHLQGQKVSQARIQQEELFFYYYLYRITRRHVSEDNTSRFNSSLFSDVRDISVETKEELQPYITVLMDSTCRLHIQQGNATIHTGTSSSL
jgi:hypothetical protein